ncbi:hypothetical protein J2W26_001984 [Variovorax boronicumulans]|nr:hypothetical protein [Variovorax boronicumulans]
MMIRIRLLRARLALQSEALALLAACSTVSLRVIFWFGD